MRRLFRPDRAVTIHGMTGTGPTLADAKRDAIAKIGRAATIAPPCAIGSADGSTYVLYGSPSGFAYIIGGPGRNGHSCSIHMHEDTSREDAMRSMARHAAQATGILWTAEIPSHVIEEAETFARSLTA